jgi:cell division protein FtsB
VASVKADVAPRFGIPGISPKGIIVVLLLGLVGAMAIEPTRQLLEQRERIAGVTSQLESVHDSNERLEHQITRLNDNDFIEQRARQQMGLVRPGETSIVVMPPSRHDRVEQRRAAQARTRVEPPPPRTFVQSVLHFIGVL